MASIDLNASAPASAAKQEKEKLQWTDINLHGADAEEWTAYCAIRDEAKARGATLLAKYKGRVEAYFAERKVQLPSGKSVVMSGKFDKPAFAIGTGGKKLAIDL